MAAEPAEVTVNYDCNTGSDVSIEHVLEDVHEILRLIEPMARIFATPEAQAGLDRLLGGPAFRFRAAGRRP